uniref:POC1 centriolar protein homolog A (Trinotate prediction) n=1 Tax=Myxobolus squamalis TaxID=59785 RepID=A0A6B2FX71_MYXSQ
MKLKCPILSEGYMLEEPRVLTFHSGGVLSLDLHPHNQNLIASGSMDSSVAISDLSSRENLPLCMLSDHKKFVVRVKWSPSGLYLVTASYDKTFCVYKYSVENQTAVKIEQFETQNSIEGLAFKNFSDEFIVSLRNNNYLLHFKIEQDVCWEIRKINMNEIGDDHVSFNAMDISFSPKDNFILVSTDRQHAILIEGSSGKVIGNHYGFLGNELSQPRHCWHPSGLYFYETCEDKSINVVSVYDQKVVHKLLGHTQLVRYLSYSIYHNVLISSSFDGSVHLWKC